MSNDANVIQNEIKWTGVTNVDCKKINYCYFNAILTFELLCFHVNSNAVGLKDIG